MEHATALNIEELLKYLPHRYPMLLVDRILELEHGKRCLGLKNVTMNEPFFQGHYPGMPIMPGVLIIEAMAQTGALMIMTDPIAGNQVPLIGAIDAVKFRKPVTPGDQLLIEATLLWYRNNVGKMAATARVAGEVVASMELAFKLYPKER